MTIEFLNEILINVMILATSEVMLMTATAALRTLFLIKWSQDDRSLCDKQVIVDFIGQHWSWYLVLLYTDMMIHCLVDEKQIKLRPQKLNYMFLRHFFVRRRCGRATFYFYFFLPFVNKNDVPTMFLKISDF